MTHLDVGDSQQNLGVSKTHTRPSDRFPCEAVTHLLAQPFRFKNPFAENGLLNQRLFVTFLTQFKCHFNSTVDCMLIKTSDVMQPFAALQIEEKGGRCTGADTNVRSVLGRAFLTTNLQAGVTGMTSPCLA